LLKSKYSVYYDKFQYFSINIAKSQIIFLNNRNFKTTQFYKPVKSVNKIDKMDLILRDEKLYNSTIALNFTQKSRNLISFSFDSYIFSQIIGHLLGDGNLSMT
jgi:hypothetical protein